MARVLTVNRDHLVDDFICGVSWGCRRRTFVGKPGGIVGVQIGEGGAAC